MTNHHKTLAKWDGPYDGDNDNVALRVEVDRETNVAYVVFLISHAAWMDTQQVQEIIDCLSRFKELAAEHNATNPSFPRS